MNRDYFLVNLQELKYNRSKMTNRTVPLKRPKVPRLHVTATVTESFGVNRL